MTKYHEILRQNSLGLSQQKIAVSCGVSKKTVNKVLKKVIELNIKWESVSKKTDAELEQILFPKEEKELESDRRMPDFEYIRKELLRNGVTKKLLWNEYLKDCAQNNQQALMYSQFCYYIQQNEEQRRATMHINRKPGEQAEVDWAGDPAYITEPYTSKKTPVRVFVGTLTYSGYTYVEAFPDEKTKL